MAGSAAAEAALVATDRPVSERLEMLSAADNAWGNAVTALREYANRRSETPNRSAEFRIQTDRVFLPAMQSLILQKFDHTVRCNTFDALLELAIANLSEMRQAKLSQQQGRYSNHFGLAHEQTTLLTGNRLLSGKILLMPSLVRSGSGSNYPTKTHDVQIASLRRGKFTHFTPMEVKSRTSFAYDLPVISARKHLNTPDIDSITNLYEIFARERDGTASANDIRLAQQATDKLLHLVTHYYHPDEMGIHCFEIEKCMGQLAMVS